MGGQIKVIDKNGHSQSSNFQIYIFLQDIFLVQNKYFVDRKEQDYNQKNWA